MYYRATVYTDSVTGLRAVLAFIQSSDLLYVGCPALAICLNLTYLGDTGVQAVTIRPLLSARLITVCTKLNVFNSSSILYLSIVSRYVDEFRIKQ